MSTLSLLDVKSSQLSSAPIVDGQIICCTDTGDFYRDVLNSRILLGSDLFLVDSLPLAPITNKLYLLKPNMLYIYDSDWIQIITYEESIVLKETLSDFPSVGESSKLYVCIAQNSVYRFDDVSGKYWCVGLGGMAKSFELTLTTSGWSDIVPYTQTISYDEITEDSWPDITLVMPEIYNLQTYQSLSQNYNKIMFWETHSGSISFYCPSEKPIIDLPLRVKIYVYAKTAGNLAETSFSVNNDGHLSISSNIINSNDISIDENNHIILKEGFDGN